MYFRFHFFKIVFVINGNLKYLRRVKGKRKYFEVSIGDEGTCLTMWRRDDLSLTESTTSEPYWVDANLRELAWLNRPSWNWVGVVLSALTRRVPGEVGKTQLRSCRSKEVIRVLGRRVKGAIVCSTSSSSPAVQNCSGDLHVCKLGGSRSNVKPACPILSFIGIAT